MRRAIVDSVLELVGETPLVRLGRLVPGGSAEVLAKLESHSPGGSVKDRVALHMLTRAEEIGLVDAATTIVEPSSGNTGIGLAMVCAARGYRCIIVMPDSMTLERVTILERFGAEVVLTPAADDMAGAVARARSIAASLPRAFVPSQFDNAENPEAHRRGTAREILDAVEGRLDAFVAGVGTGGTLTGVGSALRAELGESVRIVAVEPLTSPVLSGGRAGAHKIQGIGAGFVRPVLQTDLIDEVIRVSDRDAFDTMKALAAEEAILAGVSSGAAVFAARQVAARLGAGKRVVTMLPDSGERYLSLQHYFEL